MSLTVVSTPIGHYGDITLRAVETLKAAEVIICEELKPARVLLKRIGVMEKELLPLNEHSNLRDVQELVPICKSKIVALISDAGTPGFCDPGAELVRACFKNNVEVDVNPGPSSLMALMALSGEKLREFHFVGFLPAEKQARGQRISQLTQIKVPLIIMDTPYRLQTTVRELSVLFGNRDAVLGIDLTGEKHQVRRDKLSQLASQDWPKAPFVLLVTAGS